MICLHSPSYAVTNDYLQASPLAGPNADMQKFLNRWKD